MSFEGLPGFADDLFVGRHHAFGGAAERMGLNAHIGGEFALALRGTVESDRTVEEPTIRWRWICMARSPRPSFNESAVSMMILR